jgi:hypothetical protein
MAYTSISFSPKAVAFDSIWKAMMNTYNIDSWLLPVLYANEKVTECISKIYDRYKNASKLKYV